ncbi:uncharacterized protein BJ212DRAFT_1385041 [Suillus subaureus]|uniref:Secreted protein n=1 Tax=Suillus subaureus TaxID=48587 RepID=A0A9P7E1A2_9AGAM|nr:uncharacterized protein BJ212DRAFT_1385041 [Suillus subaureus]KAG1808008.1 hypothetical protein BJ212DRAFT_1385041 [Suillus subaureus]
MIVLWCCAVSFARCDSCVMRQKYCRLDYRIIVGTNFRCECSDLHARPTLFYSLRGHRAANPIMARDSSIQDIPCNFTPGPARGLPTGILLCLQQIASVWRFLNVPTLAA